MQVHILSGTAVSAAALALMLASREHTYTIDNTIEAAKPGMTLDAKSKIILLEPAYLDGLRGIDAQRAYTSTPIVTVFDEWAGEDERVVATTGGGMFLTRPITAAGLHETIERIAHNRGIPLHHAHVVMDAGNPLRLGGGARYAQVQKTFEGLRLC